MGEGLNLYVVEKRNSIYFKNSFSSSCSVVPKVNFPKEFSNQNQGMRKKVVFHRSCLTQTYIQTQEEQHAI
jgi:hypothetical protein